MQQVDGGPGKNLGSVDWSVELDCKHKTDADRVSSPRDDGSSCASQMREPKANWKQHMTILP